MKVNLSEFISKTEKTYGLNAGEYFKAKEGDNRMRIVSDLVPHQSEFKGKKNFRFLCYVIDRSDSVVKPYFMPMTIARSLESLQSSPDYVFDGFPMPYDINLTAKGAGSKEVVYNVIPARNNTPITSEEQEKIDSRVDIREYQKILNEKQAEKGETTQQRFAEVPAPKEEINVEDIPF